MRSSVYQVFGNNLTTNTARALWTGMIVLQSKKMQSENQLRIVFSDNNYTSVNFGEKLRMITDGEFRICGTIWQSYIDSCNGDNFKNAIELLKDRD